MKKLILDFFHDYADIYKMVRDETELMRKLMRKMPSMERHDKYYKRSHKLIPLDEGAKPVEMLKDLLKEVTAMSERSNEKYRRKFMDENDNSGDDLGISYRRRRQRSSRISPERSRRRRDSGRRDSYERRSSRRSRR